MGLKKRQRNKKFHTLIYQDTRPMMFMELEYYNCGNRELKKPGEELVVSDTEKNYLLKMKNGNPKKGGKSIFIEKVITIKEDKEG